MPSAWFVSMGYILTSKLIDVGYMVSINSDPKIILQVVPCVKA